MSKQPNHLAQLIEGACDGLLPTHARRLQKTIRAAYWLGVDDGRKFERKWPDDTDTARVTAADPAQVISDSED